MVRAGFRSPIRLPDEVRFLIIAAVDCERADAQRKGSSGSGRDEHAICLARSEHFNNQKLLSFLPPSTLTPENLSGEPLTWVTGPRCVGRHAAELLRDVRIERRQLHAALQLDRFHARRRPLSAQDDFVSQPFRRPTRREHRPAAARDQGSVAVFAAIRSQSPGRQCRGLRRLAQRQRDHRNDGSARGSAHLRSQLGSPAACEFHNRCPFVRDNCAVDTPGWQAVGPDHHHRCHWPRS